MEILVFTDFEKRKNSTKRPNDEDGVVKNVTLKDTCSLVNPSFFFGDTLAITYIKAWGYYYFVDRVAFDINGAQYMNCSMDVLASFKEKILDTKAYVLYSSSDYSVNIIDNRISQTINKRKEINVEETMFVSNPDAGCICLTVSAFDYGTHTVIMTKERFKDLQKALINEQDRNILEDLVMFFGDAVGGTISAREIPIPYSAFDAVERVVSLGTWNSEILGKHVDAYLYERVDIEIPWLYNDFRRCSNFTNFVLTLPFVGNVELAPENLIGHSELRIEISTSAATGVVIYGVWTDSGVGEVNKLIGTYSGNFGRQIPIGTDQINAVGFLGGMTTAGAGMITGMTKNLGIPLGLGGLGGGMLSMATVLAGIATATIAANKQDFTTIGGFDGGYGERITASIYLQTQVNESRIEPSEITDLYGRPCMKERKITGLTGYVETLGFDIELNSISEIKDLINSAMDKGVYIE